jgi:uncharacterized protein YndB with AHSA1/START domain
MSPDTDGAEIEGKEIDGEELGTITRAGGYFQARLERALDYDQGTLWAMLTQPARFVDWLAPGEIELRAGGLAQLNFVDSGTIINSVVSICDVPRLLEYSWSDTGEPERPVRWDVVSEGEGCRLILTLGIPEGEDVARACAGWEAHLLMLLAACGLGRRPD